MQIRCLRDPDVANPLALASQQAGRIGEARAEVKAQVDPIGMRGGEYERVARTLGESEMVRDGVDLVDELAGIRSLFEDQFSRGQREFLNGFGIRPEEPEVLRIGWTQAHRASVSQVSSPGPRQTPGGGPTVVQLGQCFRQSMPRERNVPDDPDGSITQRLKNRG